MTKTQITMFLAAFAALCLIGMLFIVKDDRHKDHDSSIELVNKAIKEYNVHGTAIFEEFNDLENGQWNENDGEIHLFVVDTKTHDILAPTERWAKGMTNAERALVYYLITLAEESPLGTMAFYKMNHPITGDLLPKRSFIKIHDGYLFGSGKFLRKKHRVYRF